MSFGSTTASAHRENAVIAAAAAGSLLIASAGDSEDMTVSFPAGYPQVVSVSAVGATGMVASYSTHGSTVDIAAPGGDWSAGSVMSTCWDHTMSTPEVCSKQGTSMAAPHVSGVAALLLAQDPSLTNDELKAHLLDYAVDAGPAGRDDFYGHGILNARNSLTQTMAPQQDLYARLVDATSGATVQTVPVNPGGDYSFTEVPDGDHFVFAGQDVDGDQAIGLPWRRWGALGGAATPTPVTVHGAGTYPASFTVGYPSEAEPNDETETADILPVGGYIQASIHNWGEDADRYLVRIPTNGRYTFETHAVDGACGYDLEGDTSIGVSSEEFFIAFNEDIDPENLNYCARVSVDLEPGTYYLGISGWKDGRYLVSAREGG